MTVTVSDTLIVVVVAVTVFARRADAGYLYTRPNVSFELLKELPNYQDGFKQEIISENVNHDSLESVVSFSVPIDDYNFLYHHKTGRPPSANLAESKFVSHAKYNVPTLSTVSIESTPLGAVPANNIVSGDISVSSIPTINIPTATNTLNVPPVTNLQSNVADNSLHHISNTAVNTPFMNLNRPIKQENFSPVITDEQTNIPTRTIKSGFELITQHNKLVGNTLPTTSNSDDNIPIVRSPVSINQHRIIESNTAYNNVQAINLPIVDLPYPIHTQSNVQFTTPQLNINAGVGSNFNGRTSILKAVTPKITKHIYFHVPPPEIEESYVKKTMPIQQQKIYKIIFVKVPSQETKLPLPLRGEAFNQVAPIEDKTIIYVLSKKSEPQQVLLAKMVPSEHEVLFVKYSGSPDIAAAQINGDSQLPESELHPTSSLHSGLVNGKR